MTARVSQAWRTYLSAPLRSLLILPMLAAGPVLGASDTSGAAILQDLRSFNTLGTVLHLAAHPDDENTQLITYYARGRGYRTAYLSLTRGDGGQNEIGPEFDEKLGVARTQELLAARELDGGRQFFTRAIDFGYSKTPEETLAFWDRKKVLGDVVRIIRQFRPDAVVTRFPIPPGSGGHGHHTASGILGLEAFKLAGDPNAYPEQLTQGLTVWQPKRVVWNISGFSRGGGIERNASITVEIGGNDPVTGESFSAIANRSRARHITQGFGAMAGRAAQGSVQATFVHLDGEPAERDLLDGVDTTWARVPGGAEIGKLADKAIADFKADNPAASVPALLAIRSRLALLPADPVVDDKREQLTRILQACLRLTVASTLSQPEIVPGEEVGIESVVRLTSNVPVKWTQSQVRPGKSVRGSGPLQPGSPATVRMTFGPPRGALALTHPYWLQQEGKSGIFRVDDPALIGRAENPPTLRIEHHFEVGGQTLTILDEPVHISATPKGERRRRLDVIPPVSLSMASDVSLFAPGSSRPLHVEVAAARANTNGILRLSVPRGWKVTPATQDFRLATVGERARFTFTVTAPADAEPGRATAEAEVDGRRYANQRVEINYPHIPLQLLQPLASARLVPLDVATRGLNVGYLPGAGDDTAEALEQLGYIVTTLKGSDLTAEKLRGLDAVVIGVRAFNERNDLKPHLAGLFAYVENGGTVIAQYNRPSNALPDLGPYPLSIAGSAPQQRVTDEASPVTILASDHPALLSPNRITPADFTGWVQERGAYFPSTWDDRYTPILAMNDPDEAPLASAVLIARHGKGHYVYTSLAFFRQLPAGVPGAYRLLANLVSLGK